MNTIVCSRQNLRAFFMLVSLISLGGKAHADQSVSYETIGNLRLKALGLELQEQQIKEDAKDAKQALTISISEDEKLRTTYRLCTQSEERAGIDASTDDASLKKVLSDVEAFGALLDSINYTGTYRGQARLAKMIASPTCDPKVSRNRQALIKKLVEDPKLLKELDVLLKQLKNAETNMLSFWQEEVPLAKKLIEALFYTKKLPDVFNKNAVFLEVGTRLGNAKTAFQLFGDIALLAATTYFTNKFLRKAHPELPAVSFKDCLLGGIQFFNPYPAIKGLIQIDSPERRLHRELAARSKEMRQAHFDASHLRKIESVSLKIAAGMNTLLAAFKVYGCNQAINEALQTKNTANYLQERLISVSTHVRALDQLKSLAQLHPEFASGLSGLEESLTLFEDQNDDLHQLVKLLMTNTFTGEASFFSRTGRVLSAYSLMQTEKDKLFDALSVLGELDACVSIAHLYKEHQGKRVVYSFAEYSEQEEPYLRSVGFWNPLVNEEVVVTNDMQLGNPCVEHHMILTGSNKGGKSTLLKAMMTGTLFSQTITIVPAEYFVATPFYLATYLNITDNTVEGKSLFMAQVERAKMIVEITDALKPGTRAFIIIDEIFTGTGVEKAAEAALKVAAHLASSPYTCFIIATHYIDVLPKLEQMTNGRCKNFKFDADKDEEGKNIFRYKLEEGVSEHNIANDILNEELSGIDFNETSLEGLANLAIASEE